MAGLTRLERWIWNQKVPGLNRPPFHYLDSFSVVPKLTPRSRCVNGQMRNLPLVGIRSSLSSVWYNSAKYTRVRLFIFLFYFFSIAGWLWLYSEWYRSDAGGNSDQSQPHGCQVPVELHWLCYTVWKQRGRWRFVSRAHNTDSYLSFSYIAILPIRRI